MEESRLPHKAYKMLYRLDASGKKNWVSNIRVCLYEHGFGHVWLNQGVGCENGFIRTFRQRLIDCRWQIWNHHIVSSERFELYKTFCSAHDIKTYLILNTDRHLKFITTRFRLGISELNVHRFRYKKANDLDLLCPLCKEVKEDELHFVLVCPALQGIRETFIQPKYYMHPCLFRLSLLLACTNVNTVRNLSLYLYKAFKYRE